MRAIRAKKNSEILYASTYSIELRQRVERLELIRAEACMHRDRNRVNLIDKQIQHAVNEWKETLETTTENELRETA